MLALSAAVLALPGCEIGNTVWLVGDSTAFEKIEEYQFAANVYAAEHMVPGDQIVPIATQGLAALGRDNSAFRTRLLSGARKGFPIDGVIVELGTNDLGDDAIVNGVPFACWSLMDTEEKRAAAIDGLMRSIPDAVPALWIAPASPAALLERKSDFRASLVLAAQRWPNLYLFDPDPVWFQGPDADAVHYTATGELPAATAILSRMRELLQ